MTQLLYALDTSQCSVQLSFTTTTAATSTTTTTTSTTTASTTTLATTTSTTNSTTATTHTSLKEMATVTVANDWTSTTATFHITDSNTATTTTTTANASTFTMPVNTTAVSSPNASESSANITDVTSATKVSKSRHILFSLVNTTDGVTQFREQLLANVESCSYLCVKTDSCVSFCFYYTTRRCVLHKTCNACNKIQSENQIEMVECFVRN